MIAFRISTNSDKVDDDTISYKAENKEEPRRALRKWKEESEKSLLKPTSEIKIIVTGPTTHGESDRLNSETGEIIF